MFGQLTGPGHCTTVYHWPVQCRAVCQASLGAVWVVASVGQSPHTVTGLTLQLARTMLGGLIVTVLLSTAVMDSPPPQKKKKERKQ